MHETCFGINSTLLLIQLIINCIILISFFYCTLKNVKAKKENVIFLKFFIKIFHSYLTLKSDQQRVDTYSLCLVCRYNVKTQNNKI